MKWTFNVYDRSGERLGWLGEYSAAELSFEFSEVGGLKVTVPREAAAAGLLAEMREIALCVDGVEVADGRWLLQAREADEADPVTVDWTGKSLLVLFGKAVVHPLPGSGGGDGGGSGGGDGEEGEGGGEAPKREFVSATAGSLLLTLFAEARARGALPGLTWSSFDGATDSAGAPWASRVSLSYDLGVDYLSILRNLVEQGVVELRMNGRDLEVYNAGGLGVDRTRQAPPVVLRRGRDIIEAPVTASVEELATAALVIGDGGVTRQLSDASAAARWGGRYEMAISQGGVSDPGTLGVLGASSLELRKNTRAEHTHGIDLAATAHTPLVDYRVSDHLWSEIDGRLRRYRVRQITVTLGPEGPTTASVVLNDKFLEREILLTRRIDGITGGASGGGSSGGLPAPADPGTDRLAPAVPRGLAATAEPYTDDRGVTRAAVVAGWLPVTTNADGTACDDLAGYSLAWRYDSEEDDRWRYVNPGTSDRAYFSDVLPGRNVRLTVSAVDTNGNRSPWSAPYVFLTPTDPTPPPAPSAPVVSSRLGNLHITWDGRDANGAAMPPDFSHLEVHLGTVDGFTPTPQTLVDQLSGPGVAAAPDVAYDTPYLVRFVAVDTSGNASEPSAQTAAEVERLVETDVDGNVIGLRHITFKDFGNLVEDGSFELAELRERRAGGGWSFVRDGTAAHGDWLLRIENRGGGEQRLVLSGDALPVTPGERLWFSFQYQRPDADGELWLRPLFHYPQGATTPVALAADAQAVARADAAAPGLGTSAEEGSFTTAAEWTTLSGYTTVPAGAVSMELALLTIGQTTGAWLVDAVQVRRVTGTALIDDAAITSAKIADLAVTNAKIANLAVNDAKIANLSVGKLLAGTLAANVVVGGRIATALSGARVEMNASGIEARNSSNVRTFRVSGTDGTVDITGTFRAGTSAGTEVRIDATTWAGSPGITFDLPTTRDFQPTVYAETDGSLRLISAETVSNSSGRSQLWLFRDHWSLEQIFGGTGQSEIVSGGRLVIRGQLPSGNWSDSLFIGGVYTTTNNIVGVSMTYGPTMESMPLVVLTPYTASAPGSWRISAQSTTGFSYAQTNALNMWLSWLAVRH
ncbi:hypothetical protein [Allostreptomyces psammosilenae]|uniref:Fibronectin type-III domain-containing protein n=1 Tax=Allostreptomyces psammosilenae TaxID=1892865 RepID=A0A852ZWZ4_9ACTN|nr:hypothetical protein [Allostreptomyces psammosilenae]NYI05254.1 hypothetical protein [Allostreptomyces psammosilenae]